MKNGKQMHAFKVYIQCISESRFFTKHRYNSTALKDAFIMNNPFRS